MGKHSSAALFSRLHWDEADLQVQTELRRGEDQSISTIVLADGAVVARSEREWIEWSGQLWEQRRLKTYQDSLVRAMERLRDEKGVDLEGLRRLFDRLVTVALRVSGTPAANALSVLPGGRWAALVAADGRATDASPESSSGAEWCAYAPKVMEAAGALRGLFGARPVADVVLRTEEGYLILLPHRDGFLAAEVDGRKVSESHAALKSLLAGEDK